MSAILRFLLTGFVVLLFFTPSFGGGPWFVATDGDDNANDGLSEGEAFRTITNAVDVAADNGGGVVYVKSGVYGFYEPNDAGGIVIDDDDAITLIGYDEEGEYNPSDLDGGEGVPEDYDQYDSGSGLTEMPVIFFDSQTTVTGIRIKSDDVTFRNFELTNCKDAIVLESADDVELENLLIHKVGNTELPNGSDGIAIKCSNSDYGQIMNCYIVDAHGQGVVITNGSTLNFVEDTTVVSSNEDPDEDAGTDYYFQITDSNANIIEDCYAERWHEDPRDGTSLVSGHKGFTIKGSSSGNHIRDCAAFRLIDAFLLRFGGTTANKIYDCVSVGESGGDVEEAHGKIAIESGAHGNAISRVRVQGGAYGVSFENKNPNLSVASKDNIFDNCIFQECSVAAIHMNEDDDPTANAIVEDTEFVNCTFVNNGGAFIKNDREGSNNQIVSCIITGFSTFESGGGEDHGFSLGYCCTFDNTTGFPTPFEDEDAEFASTLTGVHPRLNIQFYTWDLTISSPCIDRVPKYSGIPFFDHDGDSRLNQAGLIWDIGAQEY